MISGNDVVKLVRKMIGATNPLNSPLGTIRGDFCLDTGRNVIHGSDSVDSAVKEIALWFTNDELQDHVAVDHDWLYEKNEKN